MEQYTKTQAIRKIHKENIARAVLNYISPMVYDKLKSYIGTQVLKQDLSLMKKIKDEVDSLLESEYVKENINKLLKPFKEGDSAKIGYLYLRSGEYDLSLNLSICFNGGDYENKNDKQYCEYHEKIRYIFKIEKRILKENYSGYEYEQTYKYINETEQLEILEKAIILNKQLEELKDTLHYSLKELI